MDAMQMHIYLRITYFVYVFLNYKQMHTFFLKYSLKLHKFTFFFKKDFLEKTKTFYAVLKIT